MWNFENFDFDKELEKEGIFFYLVTFLACVLVFGSILIVFSI